MSHYPIQEPANAASAFAYLVMLTIEETSGEPISEIKVGDSWQVRVSFKVNFFIKHFIIALGLSDSRDVNIRTTWSVPADLEPGNYEAVFSEKTLFLSAGQYGVAVGLSSSEQAIQYIENAAQISVSSVAVDSLNKTIIRTSGTGILLNPMNIDITRIE